MRGNLRPYTAMRGRPRQVLERLSVALLQNEMPILKPLRLAGVSLSALQHVDDAEPQLAMPI
jgi:DNA polymerase IV